MKFGTVLLILHDVVEKLVGMELLSPAGDFNSPTVEQDLVIAVMVEEVIKSHGVVVQSEVDKILHALPLVMSLVK